MNRLMIIAVAVGMLTACQKADLPSEEIGGGNFEDSHVTKLFTFHVKGDFTTNYEDMTRAAVRLEDNNTAGVTDLWVLDYVDGVCQQQVHQVSTDEGFGTVPMNMTYGHHDVKFIASKGTVPVLTATALAWTKVLDTFVLDYPVDVVASSNGNRAPELKRAVSGVRLVMTDKIPEGATELRVTVADRYSSLALPSLEVGSCGEFVNVFAFAASDAGKSPSMTTYSLAPEEVWQTDVTVRAYKGTAVVSEFTIEDVELKRNRITELKGECFGRGSGFSVSVDNAWDEPLGVEF